VFSSDEDGGVRGGSGMERRPNWGLEGGVAIVGDGISGNGDS
jgi:hypothetical protein